MDGGASWTALPGDIGISMDLWAFPAFLDRTMEENPEKEAFCPEWSPS